VSPLDSNNICEGGSSLTSFTELFDLKKVKHRLVAYKEVAVEISDCLVEGGLSDNLIQLTAARIS
jgi:hypothetical protein